MVGVHLSREYLIPWREAARLCSKEVRAGTAIEYPVTTTPRGVRDPTDEPNDVVTYVLSRITSDYGSARTSA